MDTADITSRPRIPSSQLRMVGMKLGPQLNSRSRTDRKGSLMHSSHQRQSYKSQNHKAHMMFAPPSLDTSLAYINYRMQQR